MTRVRLHRVPLRLLLALALAVGLAACGDPDPEQASDDLAAMESAVKDELRAMAGALTAEGLAVERAKGHIEDEGMSTYRARDYRASAVLTGEGSETELVERAARALEGAGWERTAGGLDTGEPNPWIQMERDDFRTTIGWAKVGPRVLALSLDQAGEVEVSKDAPPVDRDNSEAIPLD